MRLGMMIDLRKCIGCGSCAIVCAQAHDIPTNLWRRIVDCGLSSPPDRQRTCLPLSCMHCEKPSCLEVCPTGATYKRSDGIVDIDPEICMGCGYCILACPYGVRSIIHDRGKEIEDAKSSNGNGKTGRREQRTGVSSKCDFCLSRVTAGLSRGVKPGALPDCSPLCVNACVSGALLFGDIDDSEGELSQRLIKNGAVRLQEELGTEPKIFYILDYILE